MYVQAKKKNSFTFFHGVFNPVVDLIFVRFSEDFVRHVFAATRAAFNNVIDLQHRHADSGE